MNICFIEWGYPAESFGGGAGTYVQLTAKELVKRGHKAFVISKYLSEEPDAFIDEGVFIKRIKIKGWHWYFTKIPIIGRILARFFSIVEYSLAVNREINKLHKKYTLDLIEFPETANFLYGIQVRQPYIVHLHGSDFTFKKYCRERIGLEDKLQRRLEGFIIKRADRIFSPSRFLKEEIIAEFNIESSKIAVLSYPVDEILLTIPVEANKDIKTIFFAGRIERRKGLDVIRAAIPLITKKFPSVRFLFVGAFSSEKFADAENIETCPFTSRKMLFEYLAKADICIAPSMWDNSPAVIYEAMAAGKAVVAAKTGGIPELVADSETGLLVAPNNPENLTRAVIGLLSNEERRISMGIEGRRRILQLANLYDNVNMRLRLYEDVLKKIS